MISTYVDGAEDPGYNLCPQQLPARFSHNRHVFRITVFWGGWYSHFGGETASLHSHFRKFRP